MMIPTELIFYGIVAYWMIGFFSYINIMARSPDGIFSDILGYVLIYWLPAQAYRVHELRVERPVRL